MVPHEVSSAWISKSVTLGEEYGLVVQPRLRRSMLEPVDQRVVPERGLAQVVDIVAGDLRQDGVLHLVRASGFDDRDGVVDC